MIDWITCKLPLHAAEDHTRSGGHFILTDHDGTVEKDSPRALPITGSHDSRLHARTIGSFLQLSGNPIKWWQGHNLFGSDDLQALLCSTAERVCQMLQLEVHSSDRATWWAGFIPLSRVDSTIMIHYQTRTDVKSVLRATSLNAFSRHGAAVTRGSTVYLGLASRRWSLKLYSKGDELESRSQAHHLPHDIYNREALTTYADPALRIELQLRSLELQRRGLSLAHSWSPTTALEILQQKLETITMSTTHRLPSLELDELPGRLIAVYEAWRAGHDIRAIYSKSTFYRYRKELLEYGIDIHLPSPPELQDFANVIPINRLLEGTPADVPAWAHGTSLYFDPPLPGLKIAR